MRALGDRNGLTVITNAVTIALEVSRSPRVKTILTGGTLRATSLEAVGPLAEAAFAAFKVTTAFLGTDGISAAGGVTTHDDTEARTNGVMVTHADAWSWCATARRSGGRRWRGWPTSATCRSW